MTRPAKNFTATPYPIRGTRFSESFPQVHGGYTKIGYYILIHNLYSANFCAVPTEMV